MSQKENFVFIASWLDAIEGMSQSNGEEFANKFARQIIQYGVTGELTTEDPLIVGLVNGMCKIPIDKSKKKYQTCVQNGKQGGRPKRFSKEDIAALRQTGLSDQEIADNLGCSVKTVQRAMNEDDEI